MTGSSYFGMASICPSGQRKGFDLAPADEGGPALHRSFGLGEGHFRRSGSLVVAWTEEELGQLEAVLQENVDAGDTDARLVAAEELRVMEPALSTAALG